ncbi:PTS sugar transporter subunit IIA [Amycolatopsis sp. EV170708-02-1]|uniref:PTS sugar transporter subunit IIA n=1 Tax=Amycolatopsis sp. EV170708-02-1 TaxID=2919322 RepID=UPI001F0C0782|nr:PTS sugar transporter subunit IIA [Amycolatopsis sp. EV170708-02-1]UMP07018.1 PTS sugar transporter subunit IIA [Amycolatopsis sp. EV170708-02-1]
MGEVLSTDTSILVADGIVLGCTAVDRRDAIDQVGRQLQALGAVEPEYVTAMHQRERSVTTFLGEGVAIPHGTDESRRFVKRTALVALQFPDGVDWGGADVRLCIGIASKGNEHVGILAGLAVVLLDPGQARKLREAPDSDTILRMLNHMDEELSR